MIDYLDLTRRGQIRRLRGLAERDLVEYGIEVRSLSLLVHLYNTTFFVTGTDNSRYVLRIHRVEGNPIRAGASRVTVESELWWLDRLRADLDLSVPAAVRTASGDDVVSIAIQGVREARLCVLFHWMEGRFVHHRLTPAHLEQVGRLMARLHDYSARLTVPANFHRLRVDATDGEVAESVVRLFRDRRSSEAADVVRAVLRRIHQTQEDLGSGPDTFGLIHADIHQENYLFSDGEVHLIDFDDCGWGHYVYDLTVTVHNIDTLPQGITLRAGLLSGYRQIRDLSPAHVDLPGAIVTRRRRYAAACRPVLQPRW